jgi:hypothetical protein
MDRGERQQLRLLSDELSGWVELATPIREHRLGIASHAVAAEAGLRRSVVEIHSQGEVAWRVMLLRPQDRKSLSQLTAYRSLPRISASTNDALKKLTGEVASALRDVQVLLGARRFFSSASSREKAATAADFVTKFHAGLAENDVPARLNELATREPLAPGVVAVDDALSDRVGLAITMGNLGGSAELLPVDVFAGLRQAQSRFANAAAELAAHRVAAVNAGTEVRRVEAARIVGGMTVDRLKDATSGRLSTAPLTDAGITTVLQVINAGNLQYLPGIGPTLATRIKGAAQTLWQTTYDEMPVRVDIKRRSPEATELLRQLRIWDATRRNVGGTDDLNLAHELGPLSAALTSSVTHAVVFCSSGTTATGLVESVERLRQRAQRLSDAREDGDSSDPWDDFLARPADYFALLSELGFLTEDAEKTHGDLPDDIIEAVRALELKTAHLSASLRGYQSFAARFALVQRKVIIGDEMGLGKTVEALAVLAHLRANGSHHSLVICPAAVVTNWVREVASKSTLAGHRLHGPDRGFAADYWRRKGGVAVTTFDSLNWLHHNVKAVDDLGCVVVDEAHYIKNPDTIRARNSRRLIDSCARSILLTGTPLENRIEEFRNLVSYLRPDLVIDASEIAPRRFRRQVAPAYLRRNQEDVLTELPELVEVEEWLPLTGIDAVAYRDAVSAGNFMAMRQAAMLGGDKSTKVARLKEIVEEAEDNGRRVVVFSYFRDVLDEVAAALPGRVFGPLTGSVAPIKRQEMVDQFSSAGHGAVLVAQIVAGGVGLNIQSASVVVICEPQLKPTMEWQAVARARRMGQLESVQVHRLLSEQGVDQRIREILARKAELFAEFARISETAESAPEAYDVSEAQLAREIIAVERERLIVEQA